MIHPFTIVNASEVYEKLGINFNMPVFLNQSTQGYFSYNYFRYNQPGNPDFINALKNQFDDDSAITLRSAINELNAVLNDALPELKRVINENEITICCIPRAQAEHMYSQDQLLFKATISNWIRSHPEIAFVDGTQYIKRHTTTATMHMRNTNYFQDGPKPYPGITNDTCHISSSVRGKDILLIDDIYTPNVNIDEDAIQCLYNNGVKSVTFYAIAYTNRNGNYPYTPPKNDFSSSLLSWISDYAPTASIHSDIKMPSSCDDDLPF